MSQPIRFAFVPVDELEALLVKVVAGALQARPAADEYISKHQAHELGLSASGFVALCRAGRFPVESRGRKYVAKRSDVLAYMAASQRPKAAPVESTPADPIEAALATGRLSLVKRV